MDSKKQLLNHQEQAQELVMLKLSRLKLSHLPRHNHQAQKLNLPNNNQQLKQSLLMMMTYMVRLMEIPNNKNRNQMVEQKTKTAMTLVTTMQITTEAMTQMLEPVRVALVATRSKSLPSNE